VSGRRKRRESADHRTCISIPFGLLGRDLMAEWKKLSLIPDHDRWIVEIEI
jgi:hypothetical protein